MFAIGMFGGNYHRRRYAWGEGQECVSERAGGPSPPPPVVRFPCQTGIDKVNVTTEYQVVNQLSEFTIISDLICNKQNV